MKRKIYSSMVSLGFVLLAALLMGEELKDHVVFRALSDELDRTIKRLKMEKMDRPYYLSYRVQEIEWAQIHADFGNLTADETEKRRFLFLDLRVGDYHLDNTRFIPQDFGYSFDFDGGMWTPLPIDEDYDAIRQEIWLATDRAYKGALEQLSKKKAHLENRPEPDRPDDFTRVKPTVHTDPEVKPDLHREEWRSKVKRLSEVFREYPKIQTSEVSFSSSAVNQFFVDSEGSSHRIGDLFTSMEIQAKTQAENGDPLKDHIGFYSQRPEDLPDIATMEKAIRSMADTLTLFTKAEKGITYSGPVLFLGEAAGEFFYEILGRGVSDPRGPLYENPMMEEMQEKKRGFLSEKMGRSLLPSTYTVYDDPNLKEWEKTPLIGHYSVDDQGVKPARTEIIEKGKLTGLLMSRLPTKELKISNGHGRSEEGEIPVGRMGNLIVQTEEGIEENELKREFLKLCKEMGLEFGIVVTKLKTPIPRGEREEMMEMFFAFQEGGRKKVLLSPPSRIYKLYTDGKKIERVRGVEFEGVTHQVLKDIVASGKDEVVYNFIDREPFQQEGLPTSVVAPPIVIEEMEISPEEVKPMKLPLLSHPYFEK